MEIHSSRQGDITILRLTGRLDAGTAPELETNLLARLDTDDKFFLIDLEDLDYISSVGLRVLLMAAKKTAATGSRIALSNLQEHVCEVFEISGFTGIFTIFPTRQAALEKFHG